MKFESRFDLFRTIERQEVLGILKQTGSNDPDILAGQKIGMEKFARTQKMWGTILMVSGFLSVITIILAIFGIPIAIAGFFVRRIGAKNLKVIESAYVELSRGSAT